VKIQERFEILEQLTKQSINGGVAKRYFIKLVALSVH
jgi:hypothetical protein